MSHSTFPVSSPDCLNVRSVVYDVATSFNPLSKDFMFDVQASPTRDGYVVLSFALPAGMTRVFVSMLEGMSGLFKFMDSKIKIADAVEKARNCAVDPVSIDRVIRARDDFSARVCGLYDGYIAGGHTVNDSIKLTNSFLKSKDDSWATYEIVKDTLRRSGRFRKKKGVV